VSSQLSDGLVTFALGDREYAAPLASIREVVRLEGLADLPGMTPPLAGVLDVRGTALPVLDLRPRGAASSRGDVLVMEGNEESLVGVAVDRVTAVLEAGDLPPGAGGTEELPAYVVQVLRGRSGPVFLVDLARMVDSARAGARQVVR
jgi:chemotaxis signal transduction protein